jgi:DNA-binding NtrC family response regulator
VAFFRPGERLFVGRGDEEVEKFAQFGRQRPGQVLAVDPREGLLGGPTLSRRQLDVLCTGDALEVVNINTCRAYFNGKEALRGVLRPGDTVMLRNEVVLLCVLRPRELPPLPPGCELHPFGEPDPDGIVGESPAAWRMRDQLARAARGEDHVLILGESGTGKELAAAAVQKRSSRARGPFVSRNAATFSPALIASELFGNPANYPNPGMQARKGLIGTAHGGTFFLDEVGECPPEAQAQLLRVMDAGEYQGVGEATVRHVDLRFLAATNRDPSWFRPDFFARFPVCIRLPPLRERPEDIPLLARRLLARPELRFSVRFVDELLRHPLPLNARELYAIVTASAGESKGEKLEWPASVPKGATATAAMATAASAAGAQSAREPRAASRDAGPGGVPSREELLACLEREDWNVARVARRLGISRDAVNRLIKKYGIERKPAK